MRKTGRRTLVSRKLIFAKPECSESRSRIRLASTRYVSHLDLCHTLLDLTGHLSQSTTTVAVLPAMADIDGSIPATDLIIETTRARGML